MIKVKIINILGYCNGILDLKKGFDKTLIKIPAVSKYMNIALIIESNNLKLNRISFFSPNFSRLIFFQFYMKISRNRLEVVVDASYSLHPY